MHDSDGFSLIELLIVLAITGVLLAVVAVSIHPERMAVNQAATGLVNTVAQARFEALKENTNAGIRFVTGGAGGYVVCLDQDLNGVCDTGSAITTVTFGSGDYGRVKLSNTTSTTVMFDRRGTALTSGAVVTLSDRSGSYSRNVAILATGKAEVQ